MTELNRNTKLLNEMRAAYGKPLETRNWGSSKSIWRYVKQNWEATAERHPTRDELRPIIAKLRLAGLEVYGWDDKS